MTDRGGGGGGGGKSTVRNRRPKKQQGKTDGKVISGTGEAIEPLDFDEYSTTTMDDMRALVQIVWSLCGLAVMGTCCVAFSWYMRQLHDNQLWFSNIDQMEQEISLRTECGLYYSYYKQVVQAPTFEQVGRHPSNITFSHITLLIWQGLYALTEDNVTEHGRTVNILQRFNVYQEVVLAGLYHRLQPAVTPMIFYVYNVFALNGFYVLCLFAYAWYVSGSWLAGLLACGWMLVALDDATRVFFTVNLRESFALPFLAAQWYFIALWLQRCGERHWLVQSVIVAGTAVSSIAFALCWQFNQFVFLIQSAALFAVATLRVAPLHKCQQILAVILFSLLFTWCAQFLQPMILGSLCVSFIPAALITLHLCRTATISGGIVSGFFKIVFQGILVLLMTVLVHVVVKQMLLPTSHTDDAHIYKFIRGKLLGSAPLDFEARIYICHGAFIFLENAFFWRTTMTGIFPLYMLLVGGVMFLLCRDMILEWCTVLVYNPDGSITKHSHTQAATNAYAPLDPSDPTDLHYFCNRRPNLVFFAVQSCFSGFVAMMTLRIKYLWYPQMAVLAAVCTCDRDIWNELCDAVWDKRPALARSVSRLLRLCLPLALCTYLAISFYPTHNMLMNDLKEFFDPDTVELMRWIDAKTAPDASFTGSMQLMAGVKACTNRHLINHPHFEDQWLRERTRRVYQVYGRRAPDDVWKLLRAEDADYVILEDSICKAPSDGCRTPDLMDIENGHTPDNGRSMEGLVPSETPRFCDEIRKHQPEYLKYFEPVMSNPTFRVYRVRKTVDDQKTIA